MTYKGYSVVAFFSPITELSHVWKICKHFIFKLHGIPERGETLNNNKIVF